MVGMLLLKQMYDQSDEDVVERWVENPYWQQFCGMSDFQWQLPCDPSDLVYFRQRIGEQGVALILAISVQMHGERAKESEVVVDSTVQEKNVTYPLDTKQYRKIIIRCWKLADKNAVRLRRRYRKEVRACVMAQRLRKDPRKRKAARRGHRRLRTIAGALMRELEESCPQSSGRNKKITSGFTAGCWLKSRRIPRRFTLCMSLTSTAWPKARSTRNTNLEPKPPWR